jgi:hypothetical protein
VREPEREPARRKLLDHPAGDRLLERRPQLGLVHGTQNVEVELGAGGRRQLEQVGGGRPQARQPPRHDLAHALRRREVVERAAQPHGVALAEAAPQLADQERVAARQLGDPVSQLGRGLLVARGAAHELGDLVGGEATESQPDDVVGAAKVGERLRQRLLHVGLRVAKGRHHEQSRPPRGPRQVAQQAERGGVGPVGVLEHKQHGVVAARALEQVGDRRVQPVALGVGIGRRAVRQQAVDPQIAERLHERAVGRTHHRVARAVEDERAAARRVGRELAHEPALARARLAADERDPPALASRPRDERAQRHQLARAPYEREPRAEAQRSGQRAHSQI